MADQDNEKKIEPVKEQPSGGSKVLIIVIIVVVVLAILGIVGGRYLSNYLSRKAGEKIASSVLSNALGGKANVSSGGNGVDVTTKDGTISVGDKAKWPTDMSSLVPEFKYGKIAFSAKTTVSGDAWSVTYEEVKDGAQEGYKSALVSSGWSDESQTSFAIADALQMTNGNLQITVIFDPSSKGASLTVSQKTQ